jgi:hypothetical protein
MRHHRLLHHPPFLRSGREAIEKFESASTGYLGGLGLPIVFAWLVGGLFAAAAAWAVGKVTLGLAVGLSRHRHAGHFRNHHRGAQE